jgi:hypothetical protein
VRSADEYFDDIQDVIRPEIRDLGED